MRRNVDFRLAKRQSCLALRKAALLTFNFLLNVYFLE